MTATTTRKEYISEGGRRLEEAAGDVDGSDRELARTARRQVKLEESRQRRITLMVGTIVLTFLFCWFPYALMFALSPFSPDIEHFFTDNHLVDLVTWLGKYQDHQSCSHTDWSGYTNSFLNPIIYAIMNPSIRTTMKKQLENIFC